MPASTEQKVDFLLKKIGYTASKSGIAEDSSLSGTKKAPFAEAIPSPLATPSSNIWADSTLIPATPPGSDTAYVKGYRTATALRMTADSSVSGSRAFIAYTTYNNTSTPILGDWIDTQFGADYIVKVYKGDPNSSGVQLSAAGAGSNDTWFFDYASGVLNFNGTQIPSGVTDTNIYIVAYRYIGAKGARPAAGIATFKDLYVTGLSTFVGVGTFNSHLYVGGNLEVKGTTKFDGGTITLGDAANDNVVFGADVDSHIIPDDNITYDLGSTSQRWRNVYTEKIITGPGAGTTLGDDIVTRNLEVTGLSTFIGNIDINSPLVDIDGHLEIDNVNISGVATATDLKATNFIQVLGAAGTSDKGLEARSTSTESTATNKAIRVRNNSDANTFSVSYTGYVYNSVTELTDWLTTPTTYLGDSIIHHGDLDTKIRFPANDTIRFETAGSQRLNIASNGNISITNDLDVDGHTELDNVNVSGVITAAQFTGPIISPSDDITARNLSISGVSTFAGNIDINSPLVDIDGHLEVDNVHVAGVTTFTGAIDANSSIDVAGTSTLNDDVTFTGAAANVVWDKSDNRLEFADNASIGIGNDDDLELSHDGTTSLIRDKRASGSSLKIGADSLTLQNKDGNEPYLVATDNGSVDIYYDFSKKFSTTGIGVSVHNGVGNTATIAGPSNLIIDPGVVGDDTGSVRIKGDLYVDGSQFVVASGTIELEDHVVGIATTAGTNALLDGGGIGIGSANIRKTLLWNNASAALKSSENFDLLTGKVYKINGASVLSTTTLGPTVVDSSLKNLGTLIDLDVAGISTFTGNIDANANLDVDGQTDLDVLNVSEAATFSSSVDVDGQTELDHLNVAGVSTFAGIARFNGDIDANGHVDIDGHTELDNVNISGVTTTAGLVDINAGGQANTFKVEDLTDNRVVIAGTGGELEDDANLTFNGVKLAVGVELDVDGQTTLDHVNVAGVSTFAGDIDANGHVDIDGHLEVDNVNVAGVSTLTTLRIGNTNNITSILDEDNMASNSATALATQQSIKAYVDDNITAQDLDITDGTTAISIDLDSETLSLLGTADEVTSVASGNSVTLGLPNNVVVSSGLTATNLSVTGVSTLTTLRIGNTNNITHIRDEDNMASDSATSLATQQSIKAYVDSQVTAQDLDFQADTGGALSIDLDSEVLGIVGTSYEIETAGSGNNVTIGLPNNVVVSSGLTATNLSVTGVSTLTTLRIGNTNNIDVIRDEDNMASDDVNALATQQSIKAYVDSQVTAQDLDVTSDSGTIAIDLDSETLDIAGTANEIETSASGNEVTIGLPNNVTIGNNLDVTAALNANGDTNLGNATSDTITATGRFDSHLVPSADSTYDLGSSTLYWRNVYADNIGIGTTGTIGDDIVTRNLKVTGISTFIGNMHLLDNSNQFKLGAGSGTLFLRGDSANNISYLEHGAAGDFLIKSDGDIKFTRYSGGPHEKYATFNRDGSVDLYFDNVKRFNTSIDGVHITGVTSTTSLNVSGISTLTDLRIGNANSIDIIRDEDNMASNDVNALATQQSIKAYVDAQVTASDLDFQADTGGALSIDLDSEVLGIVGTANEIETAGSGNNVTIGLPNNVVVSSGLTATNLSITGVSTFAGAIDANGHLDVDGHTELDNLNVAGVSTFAGAIDANGHVDIDGHTELDNVNIAGVSTLSTLRIGNTNNITSILDEDNMASNSATALATQQSIKAYVDSSITAQDLDVTSDSGTIAIDLDSETLSISGTANEIETSATGNEVTIGLPNNVTIGNNLTVTAILDVDGHTELDNLNVAGVSTFAGTVDANGMLDVDGHTELDNVNVSGIVTTTNLNVGVGGTTITTQNTTSRVGINSTSPAYMLDVGGIINSSTDVRINGVSVVDTALNDAVAMAIALG